MHPYKTFTFDSYSFVKETGKVELHYSLDDRVRFTEILTFPMPLAEGTWDENELDSALFALHLIGGISYYKTYIPEEIVIRSGTLNEEQAIFWNSVYENGLGEFAYKNNVNMRGKIIFPLLPQKEICPAVIETSRRDVSTKRRVFVPIGGGKDSVVTAELAKAANLDITLLRIGAHPFITALAKSLDLPLLEINRQLSPALFDLNAQGALNGHVPITAYLSFLSIVASLLYDTNAVLWSSERSASEGNLHVDEIEVNHQWSKSLEFEKSLQDYSRKFITRRVDSFSALRPLSELHIVKLFAEHPKHFEHVTSCNTNWKILHKSFPPPSEEGLAVGSKNRWCCKCPKCAFVYCLFAAFLNKKTLEDIFGATLYADASLEPLYKELLGVQGHKPFECVGMPDETKAAFLLTHKRGDLEDTYMMKMFVSDVLPTIKNPDELIKVCMTPSTEHAIPKEFQNLLLTS